MTIPKFAADTPADEIYAALADVGCAVVTEITDQSLRDNITSELEPHMARAEVAQKDKPKDFYPGRTRRIAALATYSNAITDHLMGHPLSKHMCDRHLLPNSEEGYQLHVSAALEVGPGARQQVLHREEDPFAFFSIPRPNIILASMWAISDFRADNGATLLVPGSHTWPEDRVAQDHEIISAEMPAGSVLYWVGGLLHGAGANISQDWRYGVILTYSLGWVRQEENQYLNVPKRRFKELTADQRRLLGFDMYDESLGFYDPSIS